MGQMMNSAVLQRENCTFAGTGGVSQGNRGRGFVPAFLDKETGAVYLSCGRDGCAAPVHLLDGLPEELVVERAPSGRVCAVKPTIVAGFLKQGLFYTREQAAKAVAGEFRS